jgi:hypothetical protein
MAPINRTTFSYWIDRNFDKLMFDEYASLWKGYKEIANVSTSDQPFIREGMFVGTGPMVVTGEGQPFYNAEIAQVSTKTMNFTDVSLGYDITRQAAEDDYNKMASKIPGALANSALYTFESYFWDIFNSGFVTTARTVIDGLALFTASHTSNYGVGGSATQSNLGTAGALSTYTLREIKTLASKLKNFNGVPTPVTLTKLIVPPELEDYASALCKAEMNPENANHEPNQYKGMTYMVCPYLTSTTAWYVAGVKHDARFTWRRALNTVKGEDMRTGNKFASINARFLADIVDWRGLYGNAGS